MEEGEEESEREAEEGAGGEGGYEGGALNTRGGLEEEAEERGKGLAGEEEEGEEGGLDLTTLFRR